MLTVLAVAALLSCKLVAAIGNDALKANKTVANADLTTKGSDFLWAVFAVMLASALGTTVWAMFLPGGLPLLF